MTERSFEEALSRLEDITTELEGGQLTLEASLERFEEGMGLIHFCSSKLDETQKKIDILLEKDGTLSAEPFYQDKTGLEE